MRLRKPKLRRLSSFTPALDPGPFEELWVAIVHLNNSEALLTWRVEGEGGTPHFLPVAARTRKEMDIWLRGIAPHIENGMEGEDISLRRYRTYEFVEWIRKS